MSTHNIHFHDKHFPKIFLNILELSEVFSRHTKTSSSRISHGKRDTGFRVIEEFDYPSVKQGIGEHIRD